jgi:MarR family transcriptional regulator, transcriptional regulator for hemolysin
MTGLLTHAGHVLTSQLAAALGEIGLTPRGYCVLFHAMEQERTQIQLAELADADKTTMVVTVDALEKAGLAERRPSRTDRRARIIVVTEAGRRKAEEGMRIVDRVHEAVLDALPADERTVFVRALERLVGGHLARPAESGQVRRAREATK